MNITYIVSSIMPSFNPVFLFDRKNHRRRFAISVNVVS